MTTWAILATGESMSQEIADKVRGKCKVIAVSNAYKLAPWADIMVSNDSSWWRNNPDALNFSGKKYCAAKMPGTEQFKPEWPYAYSCNSGLLGMRVALKHGATKILLLGFDMKGTHYFGPHPEPLKNTTAKRFQMFLRQFDKWKGCKVINCTPGSALKKFPFDTLENVLP